MAIIRRTRLFIAASGDCLVVLAVVVWSQDESCVLCVKVVLRNAFFLQVPQSAYWHLM